MALFLPRWPTDCLKRRNPELGDGRPLALYEKQKGAMRIVGLNREASGAGLFGGQSLADARALLPTLYAEEIDHPTLLASFNELANWHAYASPLVSVLRDRAPYGDLTLDITGVAHLFGGESALLDTVSGRLETLGFTVGAALADSVGAAWALAHYRPGTIVSGDAETVLADLPIAALRLAGGVITGLEQMGLKRIGQLYGRDRKALQARFGTALLRRLDQALGHLEERPTPLLPVPDRFAERRFAEPIALMDDVLLCTQDLATQLAKQLEAGGLGGQGFHLHLFRVDGKLMSLSVNAARATRDPHHIGRLFTHRVERLTEDFDAGFGIDCIRLAVTTLSPVGSRQVGAFQTPDGAEDLDRLYDRMTSRLGPLAVVSTKFVNTHIPERSVRLEPVVARTAPDIEASPDPALPRPLRLLPSPEPITVKTAEVPDGPPPQMIWRRVTYRFIKTSGPERIGVEWWRPGEGALTRDYYVTEDEAGRRFWVFREGLYGEEETPRWFLHGFFS